MSVKSAKSDLSFDIISYSDNIQVLKLSIIIAQGAHSACDEPPVDFKTKVPLLINRTFVLKSTGGSSQAEWSPL